MVVVRKNDTSGGRKFETRLTEIGGNNIPRNISFPPGWGGPGTEADDPFPGFPGVLPGAFARAPNPGFIDYFNDGGNVTTLNHTLWSANIVENATIADVMDIGGSFICAEYL